MKLRISIWYCVFIYFNFIYSQDISADDLKLLESFQLQRLRDFIRKGTPSVSKVPFSASDEDFFQEERKSQTTLNPSDFDFDYQGNIQIGGMMHEGMPAFQVIPPSKSLTPGESIVFPNFVTPSTTTSRPKKRRKQTRRPSTTPESTTMGPSNEDFEELAKILQKFRNSQTTMPPPLTTTLPPSVPTTSRPRFPFRHQGLSTVVEQTSPEFQEFIVSPLSEKWKGMASPFPSEHHPRNLFGGINIRPSKLKTANTSSPSSLYTSPPSLPTLIPMEEADDILFPQKPNDGELVAITQEEWESKMREISRKLGNYLLSVKQKKEREGALSKGSYQVNGVQQELRAGADRNFSREKTLRAVKQRTISKAYVTLLREGFMHQTTDNMFTFVASISLIRDSGKVILVDTGLATDINGRTDLIQKLSKLNIAPPEVNFVVTTHGHPDHAGNTNDFPDSIHYQGNFIHYRTKFNVSELVTSNSTNLTPNVRLLKTPGHTAEDISVLISNTDKYGTIAISGDIFMSDKDIDYPMMWKKFSINESQQEQSRRQLICMANYIVPGHGKVFRVTSEMKNGVNCGIPSSRSQGMARKQ